jgi:hypothetical protein
VIYKRGRVGLGVMLLGKAAAQLLRACVVPDGALIVT